MTAAQFQVLADVPPGAEWFANARNTNTERANRNLQDFTGFLGID